MWKRNLFSHTATRMPDVNLAWISRVADACRSDHSLCPDVHNWCMNLPGMYIYSSQAQRKLHRYLIVYTGSHFETYHRQFLTSVPCAYESSLRATFSSRLASLWMKVLLYTRTVTNIRVDSKDTCFFLGLVIRLVQSLGWVNCPCCTWRASCVAS